MKGLLKAQPTSRTACSRGFVTDTEKILKTITSVGSYATLLKIIGSSRNAGHVIGDKKSCLDVKFDSSPLVVRICTDTL